MCQNCDKRAITNAREFLERQGFEVREDPDRQAELARAARTGGARALMDAIQASDQAQAKVDFPAEDLLDRFTIPVIEVGSSAWRQGTFMERRFRSLGSAILSNVPEGRERATALTHLESALHFVIVGIGRQKGSIENER